jgi:glucose-6-phosphate 1-epimerase
MDLTALRNRLQLPASVKLNEGQGGLPLLTITTPVSAAEVYLHGAHVAQFTPKDERPLLFVSKKSHFAAGKPIRGGVPIIFPWFGPNAANPSHPAHGFARTRSWDVASVMANGDGAVAVRLTLAPDATSRQLWPHEFALAFTVTVGRTLHMAMEVRNVGDQPFQFEEALHTYLAVSDVRKVKIAGLAGRDYLDKPDGAARKTQRESPFGITGETDRVYLDTPDTVVVTDPGGSPTGGPRVLSVAKEGSATTVVWNPWIAKAAAMADFGDDEWPEMLCIETANAASNAVTLAPGQTHVMTSAVGLA